MTIEQVIADARGEAAVLRKHGQEAVANAMESLCDQVARATEPYTVWLSEAEAMLRSGHRAAWLRAQFGRWAEEGLARWNPRATTERQYLQCVIPRRKRRVSLVQDAIQEARGTW